MNLRGVGRRARAVLPLVGVALGCGGTTVVDVTEYDQSCQNDGDCALVVDGDICCGCPNAAINHSDLDRYQADLGECDAVCTLACVGGVVAFCNAGTCDTRTETP